MATPNCIPHVPSVQLHLAPKARQFVNHAVRDKVIPRVSTLCCALCHAEAAIYHHWSYLPEHWMDITPLCSSCHGTLHQSGRDAFLDTIIERLMRDIRRNEKYPFSKPEMQDRFVHHMRSRLNALIAIQDNTPKGVPQL